MDELIINDKRYFDKIKEHSHIICYGAGSKGVQTVDLLREKGIEPFCFIDSDEKKWGKNIDGLPVYGIDEIRGLRDCCILITTVYKTAVEIRNCVSWGATVLFCANPYKSEKKFLTMQEVVNDDNFRLTYDLLSDEKSKKIWIDHINWKITGNSEHTAKWTEGDWLEFFYSKEIPIKDNYTYVDVGAYTGDTIIRFLAFCRGKYHKIYAFEPDEANYIRLKEFIENSRLPEESIYIEKRGLWSENTLLSFSRPSDNKAYESSNFFCDTSNILPTERLTEGNTVQTDKLEVCKLDNYSNLFQGELLIKIDALSSEYEIICGAKEIIKNLRPVIVMEIGTRYKNTLDTIPLLWSLNKGYKFYLRQLKIFDNSRTILIAR